MAAYYNEIDPYAAQWLRNLIDAGHIARGDVDERSIVDVQPDDLRGYSQAHFFAGIGGWSIALRLAGWPDDRPVWTGSCPCQPFSAAGAGKAADDERHLWPAWFPLIAERRPPIVFGEQVEAAIGWGWLDAVFVDLESEGYACGASVLPACSVGAPHIRNRVWFVADAGSAKREARDANRIRTDATQAQQVEASCRGGIRELGHAEGERPARHPQSGSVERRWLEHAGVMGDAAASRLPRQPQRLLGSSDQGFWIDCAWLECTDGKSRPIEPGSFPLAHGIQQRPSKLRAYGNAIVPQCAAEFIRACEP